MRKFGMLIFTLMFFIAGCNKGNGGGQMTVTQGIDYEKGQTLYAWVDALRMRAQPDPALEAIANLNTGDKAVYLGEVSENTATFELRGKEITAPFLKVKLTDGTTGWVFAGGLQADQPASAENIITVGLISGCDFKDLQKAIDNAQPGTIVRIQGGVYNFRETINIDGKKDIVIEPMGSDKVELVNLDSYDHVISMERCENVTIRGIHAHHKEMAECYGAVVSIVDSESITIEECDLNGCGVEGVRISDSNKVTVKKCLIHDNSEAGIVIDGNFSGIVIENNRLEWNYIPIYIKYQDEVWDDSHLQSQYSRFIKLSGNNYVFEEEGGLEYYEEGEYGD